MGAFHLRGAQIHVERSPIYASSRLEARQVGQVLDEVLTVHAVITATRDRSNRRQQSYAYIDESRGSARGFWLDEAVFSVIELPE